MNNPFVNLIGKTISNIKYFGGHAEIETSDGESGYIDACGPSPEIRRVSLGCVFPSPNIQEVAGEALPPSPCSLRWFSDVIIELVE